MAGFLAVTLGIYLTALGHGVGLVGLVVASGFAGSALATLAVAARGDRWGRRRVLLSLTLLSGAGIAGVALTAVPLLLVGVAFLGAVNGMGRDRGGSQALDQSILSDGATGADRTRRFVWYTLVQDAGGAVGSAAAGAPALLGRLWGLMPLGAMRTALLGAALVALVQLPLYALLPRSPRGAGPAPAAAVRPEDRRRVAGLAALFVIDSLGGGFLAGTILSYWFFRRFALSAGTIGLVFAGGKLLNAVSYFGADALARRIGLLRTMVFTHLPSSAMLAALPLVGAPAAAITLYLAREGLVQMDVPARQAYVAAVVPAEARTFALGVTNVARYAGWATGPALAGAVIGAWGLGAPLLMAAGLKATYDVALFLSYRKVLPEGEAVRVSAA